MPMNSAIAKLGRRLRLGVIGGGPGSFIGEVHRTAARLDDNYEIVASVLSSDPERSRAAGRQIGLAPERAYGAAAEMFAGEAGRADGMEVVAIMTPNDSHHALCCAALERGLDIVCDKPLTTNLPDALDLVRRVRQAGVVFCHTFNYTAFPMVRQARAMVADGDIGEIRMVQVEYVQGHNASLSPGERGAAAAAWRHAAGAGRRLADPRRHRQPRPSHGLLRDGTAIRPRLRRRARGGARAQRRRLCGRAVPARRRRARRDVGDPGRAPAPSTACISASSAPRGGLEWFQEEPNQLHHSRLGQPALVFERHGPGLKPAALRASRIGIGHPEGFQEAFAVLYAEAAEAIVARRLGHSAAPAFPTVEDGARTMKFIDAALESSRSGRWADCRLDLG